MGLLCDLDHRQALGLPLLSETAASAPANLLGRAGSPVPAGNPSGEGHSMPPDAQEAVRVHGVQAGTPGGEGGEHVVADGIAPSVLVAGPEASPVHKWDDRSPGVPWVCCRNCGALPDEVTPDASDGRAWS
jgi:hypothetical protein